MQEKTTELMKNHVGSTSSRPHSRGITLIALIITIIVMLILVGVTVNVALNGGLFEVAKRAVSETQIEADKEVLQSEVLAAYDVNTGIIDTEKLKTNLEAAGWNEETEKRETIYISPKNNKFTVDENLEIEYVGKVIEEPVIALEDDNNPLTIGAIEDLVDLAITVNAGTTYEGETVTLVTSLDFDNPESYRNSEDTSYGDINGNGTAESIITELTTGLGFEPIGKITGTHEQLLGFPIANSFAGTFDGNGKTISNLYINRPTESAALFGDISTKTTIKNLTIKNAEIYGIYASGLAIANSVPNEPAENVVNYMNDVLTIENCHTKGGKIGAVNENCVSQITAGLFINPKISIGNLNIKGNSNGSTISGLISVGVTYLPEEFIMGEITITECNNYGDIIVEDIDVYNVASEEHTSFSVGCVVVSSPCEKGLVITDCSNYGDLTEINSSIVGVAATGGASIINCSNYGTLNLSGDSHISIAGIFVTYRRDEDKIQDTIKGCKNYGDINASCENATSCQIAGITMGSSSYTVVKGCINKGNINVSGNLRHSSSNELEVAGIDFNSIIVNKCINYGNINENVESQFSSKYISGISCDGFGIVNCANYGDLNGAKVVGVAKASHIFNCYNSGNITSYTSSYAGVGMDGQIRNSYNLGAVTGVKTGTDKSIGEDATITNCHALTGNETAEEKQTLLTALNTNRVEDAEMSELSELFGVDLSWSEWKKDSNINNGYPVFSWEIAE